MDFRPDFEAEQSVFGVDATVTPPGGDPTETKVVWLPPTTVELPAGEAFRRVEARRVVAVSKSEIPELPRGTIVAAPLVEGGDVGSWKVDEVQRIYEDHYRATVVEAAVVT